MEWRRDGEAEWLEAELPFARAAFSTRKGGISQGPVASLNLGIFTEDDPERVIENRRRLAGLLGLEPERIVIGHQVHGADLAAHAGPQRPAPFRRPGSPIPDVDGHVTSTAGLAALVFVADCLPVALGGPGGVAMLHCGWRGLAAGILERGATAVEATDAAIGPGIGPCCYEVGDEVLAAFARLGDGVADGPMLDLTEVARRLLFAAGVERIEVAGCCTSCDEGRFFSHRRDGRRTGRQAGLVWIEPAERSGG
jgi:YfiH family protein